MADAKNHTVAVGRAGHPKDSLTLGANLFRAILGGQSGIVLSRHEHEETWGLVKTPGRRACHPPPARHA
jgi:hypothetical protein